jgi:hypothetical protein
MAEWIILEERRHASSSTPQRLYENNNPKIYQGKEGRVMEGTG